MDQKLGFVSWISGSLNLVEYAEKFKIRKQSTNSLIFNMSKKSNIIQYLFIWKKEIDEISDVITGILMEYWNSYFIEDNQRKYWKESVENF